MARGLVSCLVPCALLSQVVACVQQLQSPEAPSVVLDRREAAWAVVQHLEDGRVERIPVGTLPTGAREGDVLVRNQRAAELRELLLTGQRAIRAQAASGSFSLEDPPSATPLDKGTDAASEGARTNAAPPATSQLTQALTPEEQR